MQSQPDTSAVITAEPEGTWLVPLTARERWAAVARWVAPTYTLTAWLFYLQFQYGPPAQYMLWGFGLFALGTLMGVRAFRVRERRMFDCTQVYYTRTQRLKRAARWFVPGVATLVFIWWVQLSADQFSMYWWYAWPALLPILVGVGLYLLRSERVLSVKGQVARAQVAAAQAQVTEARNAQLAAVAGSWPARYIGAAGCLYVAYWFATDHTGKNAGWAALMFAVFALILARELSMWMLGIGAVLGICWALFSGVAALPVSVAVIIGALIIASAVGKK